MFKLKNFEAIKIGLASPEKIREWSRGEVKKPETINYRTLKPERDGLFCERIFGPTKDWECHCGKYKRVKYKGVVCDRCGVEVTRSKVRRERMGHIELAAPVAHIWYVKGIPSRMGLLLDMSPRALEKVLYFVSYVVIDPGDTPLTKKQLLSEKEYREYLEKYGNRFRAGMGAEAIKELLQEIDLEKLSKELRAEIKESTGQKRVRAIRRLEVVQAFIDSGNRPEWMILEVLPVIPPDLRPMVQLDGGRFATSDLNDLYRRVINRNNRLKKLLDLGAPDIIVRNEKRMLQEAVDALIDNGRRGRPVTGPGNRPLKSLSDMLKGKQGRFRQNLLGKRVDYSGRSVIVVGPELKVYQCGLPKEMALELFKPFVMKRLVDKGLAQHIKSAKRMVERVRPEVWDVLEEVIKEHPVLLNRAPTLHRLGIQAFEPVLVEGRAIKLHPLVCPAYNADFDGDQMAVHIPLSMEAQAEARFLMLAANNILKPQDGKPVMTPTQDMVLGCYYLTADEDGVPGEGKYFSSPEEALMAYQLGYIHIHAKIKVKMTREINGEKKSKVIETTVGKIIFNEAIPQDLGFVDRNNPETAFNLEINDLVDKSKLGKILDRVYRIHGPTKTAETLDKIKELGFKYSTKAAITISVSDMVIPKEKEKLLKEADEMVAKIEAQFRRGLISEEERYEKVIETWNMTTEKVTEALMATLDKFNPIFMMAHSGARGSKNQIRQLAGMRGLMADPSGRIIELPIRSNFREGLNVLEFFISTHGARKGLADTALRTADSGYLTRRLVDVSQDVIVREEDCGTDEGIYVEEIREGNEIIEKLSDRIIGRIAAEDIVDSEGNVIVRRNEMINEEEAEKIDKAGITRVKIRSPLTCRSRHGVCRMCYGRDLATGELVNIGEAVGIIAAQAIGEPGTQLTMRTFHTGGVAGVDITQGLPRVEELFEARKPKGLAVITEISGVVRINESKKRREITVVDEENNISKTYLIPYGSRLKVRDGQWVQAGDELTEGSVNPHDLLKIKGIYAVQSYLLQEVQKVYRLQGVEINDKHIEIIIRQMMKKVKVEDPGDTSMLPGELIDMFKFEEENKKAIEKGLRPATGRRALLGITKAALATDSFLSAASFQETTRVLTDAAIKGKVDPLIGLKENVIIGKLIPAGTGLSRYRNITVVKKEDQEKKEEVKKEAVDAKASS
ncbi:DNA-directed RNA polymerase subunit beta' [Caldanaerobacter subterraneus subsp. tengcongensis MB4]|uniref:DNA-directed RNA polymerase subunit beta' n=1 Tax=Caldanaerobacter subterraneus subsp. tengcongensis (strain DSM 15242 / JCM 11007 / NBRC 100824 / MB4) TaxID=273068 RepID=RPOC_CALS4|nr:DNA-directed RNA polymerase subunit beta' [Caldanaerobacter subterraneus]Q8R7U7.1 RecName: Full=DNA-directed RNA polymerase subunit beta'; Short=RNAP subunit beta'; AltName: Full=RNA polymerase subunit beta'; AltName: Full=Transcriptase subunit beta' [Caldanaerobacter subterraneus subsp. tengcongensis MB4]AAM25442.1 DNA-directed RNA polymerase beta subunit/160 kD subunit (split gene in archaea and Syn) [Caldanaerobacter subterraneus subsp. tengcongensis MB4]MCS3914953.1 DNA-directed RNA polym